MPAFDRATLYRSAFYAVAMQWGVRAIGLVSVVVLARLLTPADFGIVALAMSAAAFVELFGWIGLRQALLRVAEPERAHYDTAFTIQFGLFTALALVLVAAAPLAAAFYGHPALSPILWVLALRLVCLGLVNIGIVDFEREMQFARDLRLRLGVRLASLFVTVTLAMTLKSYWAIVWGLVAYSIFYVAASYAVHPYRPRFSLSRRSDLLGVSLWMFVSSLAEWVQTQIERLVLGRFAAPATVGLYSVSKDLSIIFTQEITAALNRVTFVTVAGGGARNLAKVIGGYAAVVAPMAAGLVATAPDAIALLLGEQWLPAAPLLRIIAIYAGAQAVYLMAGSVLQASGLARRAALLNLSGAALAVSSVAVAGLVWRTPEAVALAALAVSAVMTAAAVATLASSLGSSLAALGASLLRPVAAAAAMVALLWGPGAMESGSALLDLLWAVPAGALAYAATLVLLWLASGRPEGAESEAALVLGGLRRRWSASRA
jgi:O-antigen/teichoic acid export membrane protein